jgi:hypothetical protein
VPMFRRLEARRLFLHLIVVVAQRVKRSCA